MHPDPTRLASSHMYAVGPSGYSAGWAALSQRVSNPLSAHVCRLRRWKCPSCSWCMAFSDPPSVSTPVNHLTTTAVVTAPSPLS